MGIWPAFAKYSVSVIVWPPLSAVVRSLSTISGDGPVRRASELGARFTGAPSIVTDDALLVVIFVSWSPLAEVVNIDRNTPASLPAGSDWLRAEPSTKALLTVIPVVPGDGVT